MSDDKRPKLNVVAMPPRPDPAALGWSPEQLALDLVKEIQSGEIKPVKMFVLFYQERANGDIAPRRWRAGGATYAEEIALLETAKLNIMREWENDDGT